MDNSDSCRLHDRGEGLCIIKIGLLVKALRYKAGFVLIDGCIGVFLDSENTLTTNSMSVGW